jgi:hypothetical protein
MAQKGQLATSGFGLLRIVHLAVVAGITIFCVLAVILVENRMIPVVDESVDRILQLIVVVVGIAAVFLGFKLFQNRILNIRQSGSPAGERIRNYRTACFTWWIMLEVPAMFAVIGFLLTANYAFFAVALFLWLILLLFTPRKDNIVMLLNLNGAEVEAEKF